MGIRLSKEDVTNHAPKLIKTGNAFLADLAKWNEIYQNTLEEDIQQVIKENPELFEKIDILQKNLEKWL